MVKIYVGIAVVVFFGLFYISYNPPIPIEEPAIDMGIWSETNKGNSLAEK
jgi:hypothetical protein